MDVLLQCTDIDIMMYRNGTSHVPKSYSKNTCTEMDLICTEVVMYRKGPPLCTETVMYRKRRNSLQLTDNCLPMLLLIVRLEARLHPNIYGRFDGIHAFEYNSTESEPILMKSRAL